MKKLPLQTIEKITDFEAESELSLPSFAIEKDYFVFEVIRIINSLPDSQDFRLVFCGGTCLAKAYGILHRMSEDIDFKLVPTQATTLLSKAALKRKLSTFVKNIIAILDSGGFKKEFIERRSNDGNSYSCLDIEYESAFSKPSSLRSHLLLEINYAKLYAPTQQLNVGLLFDKLNLGKYHLPLQIECVALEEALAEKLISFPRRLALHLQNLNSNTTIQINLAWDKALVRHLYDVHQIGKNMATGQVDLKKLASLLINVITKDAIDFKNQHPNFYFNPISELNQAILWAENNKDLNLQYTAFVNDMVYATTENTPTFAEAFGYFSKLLRSTLSLIEHKHIQIATSRFNQSRLE